MSQGVMLSQSKWALRVLGVALLVCATPTLAQLGDPLELLSPITAPAQAVIDTTMGALAGSAAPAVAAVMSTFESAAVAPATSAARSFEEATTEGSSPVASYVNAITSQVAGASGLTPDAWQRYLPAWAPAGYTGPVTLRLQANLLPTERPVESWLKDGYLPYSTAKVTKSSIQGGYKVHIEHAPLTKVTPEQIQWWFLNIGGNSKNPSDGKTYPNYLLMHPRDHIQGFYPYVNDQGVGGKGATIRYTEIFMSNATDGYLRTNSAATLADASFTQAYVDVQLAVVQSDVNGVSYEVRIPAINAPVFKLEWKWKARQAPDTGVDYTTDITIMPYLNIPDTAYQAVLQAYHGLDDRMYRHIVEEIGNLDYIVPLLYTQNKARTFMDTMEAFIPNVMG